LSVYLSGTFDGNRACYRSGAGASSRETMRVVEMKKKQQLEVKEGEATQEEGS